MAITYRLGFLLASRSFDNPTIRSRSRSIYIVAHQLPIRVTYRLGNRRAVRTWFKSSQLKGTLQDNPPIKIRNFRAAHYDLYRPLKHDDQLRMLARHNFAQPQFEESTIDADSNKFRTAVPAQPSPVELTDGARGRFEIEYLRYRAPIRKAASKRFRSHPQLRSEAVDFVESEVISRMLALFVSDILPTRAQWFGALRFAADDYWRFKLPSNRSKDILVRILSVEPLSKTLLTIVQTTHVSAKSDDEARRRIYAMAYRGGASNESLELLRWALDNPDFSEKEASSSLNLTIAAYRKRIQRLRRCMERGAESAEPKIRYTIGRLRFPRAMFA